MEQIAVATGFDQSLGQQMSKLNAQIGEHLKQTQEKIRTQLQTQQNAMGENPSEAQKRDFEKLSYDLDQQYRQELNKAQQASSQAHNSMLGQFHQKITPIAQNVANERGFDIVMLRTDTMMVVAPKADITQDVLAMFKQSGLGNMSILPQGMQEMQPAQTPSPMLPAQDKQPDMQPQNSDDQPLMTAPNQLPVQ
jgi:Skp family chaperone for outer membrane proteins